MPDEQDVVRAHEAAQAKTAEAITAIEAGDEGWKDVVLDALPTMSAFTTAVQEYALGELRRLDEERAERERLEARPWWQKVLRLER